MTFSEDDTVYVIPLKGKGRITKVLKQGRYQVLVGNMQIKCKEAELKASTGKEPASRTTTPPKPRFDVKRKKGAAKLSIDLHGFTVDQAVSTVEEQISQAVLSGKDEIEIIHGIGTGKVRRAVHKLLSSLKVVKHFKIDPLNPGTTRVFL